MKRRELARSGAAGAAAAEREHMADGDVTLETSDVDKWVGNVVQIKMTAQEGSTVRKGTATVPLPR